MTPHSALCTALVGTLLVPSLGRAQGGISNAQFIKLAESGAPGAISAKAAIARIDPNRKTVTELRAGANGFTCSVIPDGTDAPYCATSMPGRGSRRRSPASRNRRTPSPASPT